MSRSVQGTQCTQMFRAYLVVPYFAHQEGRVRYKNQAFTAFKIQMNINFTHLSCAVQPEADSNDLS